MDSDDRLYRVRARNEDYHHGRLVREATAEAAAIEYVEHRPFAPEEQDVEVVVRDVLTGLERSYLIHLDPGETPEVI